MKTTTTLTVPGMTCAHCKQSVSSSLSNLPGVFGVDVDLSTRKVTVHHEAQVDETKLRKAVEDVGFEVEG
jgi:copper chaperone